MSTGGAGASGSGADVAIAPRAGALAGAAAGSGGMGWASGAPGSAGSATAGAAGSAGRSGPLTGTLGPNAFEAVKAGYAVGRSEEFGTTTFYLFDSAITCDQISSLAWLSQLPEAVQVIEVVFPSNAMTGSPVSGSVVGYAHGGMYSFTKSVANTRILVLSRNVTGGVVEGELSATFPSGSIRGTFHADFCSNGVSL